MTRATETDPLSQLAEQGFDTARHLAPAARARAATGGGNVFIIDVDAHHFEGDSLNEIIARIDDPSLRQLARSSQQVGRGRVFGSAQIGYHDLGGRITRYPLRSLEKTPGDGTHRDVHLAHRWMDQLGIRIACLFPTAMLGLALHPQPHVEAEIARAYNAWLTETLLARSPRLKALLYLPLGDARAAGRMVEDFAAAPGVVGFMVAAVGGRPIHDNAYRPVFAAIEERGLPLAFHGGFNWDEAVFKTVNRFISVHALGNAWSNVALCTNWIVNGLPERFPRLEVIWLESGVAWAAWLGQRLDNEYKMRASECPALTRLPSEYLRRMHFATQPLETSDDHRLMAATFRYLDAENSFLYSSGYPGWDMDTPAAIWNLPFLTDAAKRKILGENARRLFKLDGA